MWYTYNLSLMNDNKMKEFTEDFESMMYSFFDEDDNYFLKFNKFKRTNFFTILEKLKKDYKKMSKVKKKRFQTIFKANFDVENIICTKSKAYTFDELESFCSKEIRKHVEELCEYLYKDFKELKTFKKNYVSPLDYYKKFIEKKVILGNCPFCGRIKMELGNLKKREDYDHYLAKSTYPFVSLHYKNLVPMCKYCNSLYKEQKDILSYTKVYYPFENIKIKNILSIEEVETSLEENCVKKISISSDNDKEDENEAWDDIFKINERSKEKINELYKDCLRLILRIKIMNPNSNLVDIAYNLMLESKELLHIDSNLYRECIYRYLYEDYNKELLKS